MVAEFVNLPESLPTPNNNNNANSETEIRIVNQTPMEDTKTKLWGLVAQKPENINGCGQTTYSYGPAAMIPGQEKAGGKALAICKLYNKKPHISKRSSLEGKHVGELFRTQQHNWHGVLQNPVHGGSARDCRRVYKCLSGMEPVNSKEKSN